nr:MAG TPA: hypothetical protein [Caudoviricetes sp.]
MIKTDNTKIRIIELEGERFFNIQIDRPIKLPKRRGMKIKRLLYKAVSEKTKRFLRKKKKEYKKEKREEEFKNKAQEFMDMLDEQKILQMMDEGAVLEGVINGENELLEELLDGIKKELSEMIAES